MFAGLSDWTTRLSRRKTLVTFHFQTFQLTQQYVFHFPKYWDYRETNDHRNESYYRLKFSGILISFSEKTENQKIGILVNKKYEPICAEQRKVLGYIEPPNVFFEQVKAEGFAEGTLTFNVLANSRDEGVENFEDLGFPKNQKILDPKAEKESRFAPATHSATRLNFTAQSRKQIGMASGPCSTWDFKYCIVLCTVRVTVIISFFKRF